MKLEYRDIFGLNFAENVLLGMYTSPRLTILICFMQRPNEPFNQVDRSEQNNFTCMVLSNSFSWQIICQLDAIIHIFRFASILGYRVCCIRNINPPGADTGIFRAKLVHGMGVDIQGFYSLSGKRSYREISRLDATMIVSL